MEQAGPDGDNGNGESRAISNGKRLSGAFNRREQFFVLKRRAMIGEETELRRAVV